MSITEQETPNPDEISDELGNINLPPEEEEPEKRRPPPPPLTDANKWAQSRFRANFQPWAQFWRLIRSVAEETSNDPVELATVLLAIYGGNPPGRGPELRSTIKELGKEMRKNVREFSTIDEWFLAQGYTAFRRDLTPGRLTGRYVVDRPERPPTAAERKKQRRKRTKEQLEEEEFKKDFRDPVVTTINGVDIRTSAWNRAKGQYDTFTRWYQGREVTNDEVKDWLTRGTSTVQIAIELTRDKRFFRSPAWKSESIKYKRVYKDLIGPNTKIDKQLVRRAIVRDWSTADFAEKLRERPIYLKSNEFQTAKTRLQNIYSKIFGGPITSGVQNAVQEAAIARWTDDQFASWLRGQPEYGTSVEFQGKRRTMQRGLSAAFGVPLSTFTRDRARVIPPAAFELPDSPRIPGAPGLTQGDEQAEAVSG